MTTICIYSFSLFFLMGVLGFVFWKSFIFRYIDCIYYPLGALGIILFFALQADKRAILEFSEQQQIIEQQLKNTQALKPMVGKIYTTPEYLESSGNLLNTIVELGDACSGSGSKELLCYVAMDIGPIIKPYVKNFKVDDDIENVLYSICSSSRRLFEDFREKNVFSEFLLNEVIRHYSEGMEKGFMWADFESKNKYIESFRVRGEQSYAPILPLLGDSYRKRIREKYDAEIDFAITIMKSISVCMEIDNAITNGEMKSWKEKISSIEKRKLDVHEEVQKLESNSIVNSPVSHFNYLIWPYIIIFALALKFAKAVSITKE